VTAESTAAEHAVLRFDQVLSIAESATTTLLQLPAPDGMNWYRRWKAMLEELRSNAVDSLAKPDDRQAAAQISRPLEEQLSATSARMAVWIEKCAQSFGSPGEEVAAVSPAENRRAGAAPSMGRRVYCATDGALDRLTVDGLSPNVGWAKSTLIGVLAIVGFSVGGMILAHRTKMLDLVYQWPHAVGFVVGIACWAWLQPSWCGLVISLACVALALRSGWPGRAIRLDASTVLRASRPK
jgi:hypothetical protein